jgi:hypothetical protein
MNRDSNNRQAADGNGDSASDTTPSARKTPATDMQPEDAGTADSGNKDSPARDNPAESAMKQTSKTPSERGER